jgi:hypothetical protein
MHTSDPGSITRHGRLATPLLALAGALLLADAAQANRACNAETTKGRWMYTCEGTLPAPPTFELQANTRILGSCTATRAGVFTCEGTANLGGAILSQGLVGQAVTAASCRGTISYTQTINGGPAPHLDIVYVVNDDGDAINGLPTNSGGVLSCTLRRIDK